MLAQPPLNGLYMTVRKLWLLESALQWMVISIVLNQKRVQMKS
jgi:hypothetical protein